MNRTSVHQSQPVRFNTWASYQIRKIAGCACAGNAGNVFPRRRFQRKPIVGDPGMHHGTCVTHVPWCMSGSLTCGDGENVPGIPGACAPAILRIWQEAHYAGIILGTGSANERQRYNVTSSLIGWAPTQTDPCITVYQNSFRNIDHRINEPVFSSLLRKCFLETIEITTGISWNKATCDTIPVFIMGFNE